MSSQSEPTDLNGDLTGAPDRDLPRVVHFGACNIGRGFLGQLYYESGYRTVFLDAQPALVDLLNDRKSYPLRLVTDTSQTELNIGNVSAIDVVWDRRSAISALATADLAGTSVGVAALPKVAEVIAAAIDLRAENHAGPLDILLCENQWHAASLMRQLIEPHLAPHAVPYFHSHVGLVETVIGRMVPRADPSAIVSDPLLVTAEPYRELPASILMFRGIPPKLEGLILADEFDAYEARKLFLHNAGHAALAYLGRRRGFEFIWQAARDPAIRTTAHTALAEATEGLIGAYGFARYDLEAFREDLMIRFANQALGDTVERVAADPLRKLRPDDRLIGAANLCLRYDILPDALARVIAAALSYRQSGDPSAGSMQTMIEDIGIVDFLDEWCNVEPASLLCRTIVTHYQGCRA